MEIVDFNILFCPYLYVCPILHKTLSQTIVYHFVIIFPRFMFVQYCMRHRASGKFVSLFYLPDMIHETQLDYLIWNLKVHWILIRNLNYYVYQSLLFSDEMPPRYHFLYKERAAPLIITYVALYLIPWLGIPVLKPLHYHGLCIFSQYQAFSLHHLCCLCTDPSPLQLFSE